jgi:dolichyl-phosphate beta-glucosyltransferase
MESATCDLSLIVPAYNEEERIGTSLLRISQFVDDSPLSVEVLIVDDGSQDKTAEVVMHFIEEFCPDFSFRLLSYGENRGKGHAVAHGFRQARGRCLVFSDTDLSAPIDQIPRLMEALESGADVAIGSRRLPESVVEGLPPRRVLMGRLFSLVSRIIVLGGYADTQCGFKAYRQAAALQLVERQRIEGYTFDVEHLLWAEYLGMRVEEVPIRWIYTEGSQVNSLVDSFKMVRDLLALRRQFANLRKAKGRP